MAAKNPVPLELFDYLLSSLSGARFESLGKKLFAIEYQDQFIPLGGIHDGGADGLLIPSVNAAPELGTYFQFTISPASEASSKIVATVNALRAGGRFVKTLIYATSAALPKQDILAIEIHRRFDVLLITRDRERLRQSIQNRDDSADEFRAFFYSEIEQLLRQTPALHGSVPQFAKDPTVFSFLNFELQDRFSRDKLLDRITDSLIYWALRETDPADGSFRTSTAIRTLVEDVFPNARTLIAPRLQSRLEALSLKMKGDTRLRAYPAAGKYCLPFLMRQDLAAQNAAELSAQADFIASIRARIFEAITDPLSPTEIDTCTRLVFDTVHAFFVEQGLLLSAFLEKRLSDLNGADQVVENLVEKAIALSSLRISPASIGIVLEALRGVFYQPTPAERLYLMALSRTSLLFVTIQSAPKTIEFLHQMAGNFRLIVGTDLIIKALSERYLAPENRQISNLLHIVPKLGGVLYLAAPVVHEVFTHIHAADREFFHHYERSEPYLSAVDVAECDRILIRAYFHAKRAEGGPRSWAAFIGQFVDPDGLRRKATNAETELRGVLIQHFRMTYLSQEDLERGIDLELRDQIADSLDLARGAGSGIGAVPREKPRELSVNDATLALAVYQLRKRDHEEAIYDGFGYRTWWLTKEVLVLAHTPAVVQKNESMPYIMRPEFLLHFVLLAPKAEDVRKSMSALLPTTTGLQLGQHLPADVLHNLLSGAEQWADMPAERVMTQIRQRVDRLKFDRFKRYVREI